MTRIWALCALLMVCSLIAAGCGDDDEDSGGGSNRAAAYEAPADGTREIPISKAGAEGEDQLTAEALSGDELTEEDYAEYEEAVEAMVYHLDSYWEDAFAAAGEDGYEPPSDIYGYYPGEDTDVVCGGEDAASPENAFFCGETGEIAWDEPGLFLPYYFERGELAVGIVLAHEWGHLVQNRAEEEFPITYEQELQADCLAGSWLGGLEEEGLLDGVEPGGGGDIDLAAETIYSLGDAPDTPFEDPSAHGQPEERLDALGFGYENGIEGCLDGYGPGFAKAKGIKIPKAAAKAGGDSL